ncbi:MAG TPA: bifunctional transaldolase/phosoglucose isomerase, partial [Dehalococcoidia bacterium]|nr:bifunctional transaldolase/phosoglucose isomerase [Dehalococcoidia bacterium]
MSNPLLKLRELGQSVWYDNVRRGLITSGEFQRMVERDGVAGVTSNPTIFEKAVDGGTDYDVEIASLVAAGKGAREIYDALTIGDIQLAADVLRPTYERTKGLDGYACLEVSPKLAHDTQASIETARSLWRALDRPNVMIKIPGTPEGLPAIEQCLSEGLNINITLLFSVENYERVAVAYISALEKLAAVGRPLDRAASVASFFVSRVDTLVDAKLEELAGRAKGAAERERLESLRGKAAVANAKIAYAKFKEMFSGERWQALAAKGARVQRCLWASTSAKDPRYRDVMYVEELIGSQTVNTMPQSTLDAFRDHGRVATTLGEGLEQAREAMRALADAGVDFAEVTEELQRQGVKLFADSYDKLLESIGDKREALLAAKARRFAASLGEHEERVERTLRSLQEREFTRRLWAKDASLWNADAGEQRGIRERLGWLTVTEAMLEHRDRQAALAAEVREAGFRRVVLLGMGGSSLAPEVLSRCIEPAPGYPQLVLLDTTDPATILEAERSLDLARTLFIVSSKSGTTAETLSLFRYFYEKVRAAKGARGGGQFIAITDPGTPLEALAREQGFRHCFLNPPDVGGRFSALSYFGLAPAAATGIDVARLLDRAEALV